jgi:putative FmdB family regulatory protein
MPIYAYRCADCGHTKDVLQKVTDPVLTMCPACGASSFSKQLTAAGFQLKGSGWYATDFKNASKKDAAKSGDAGGDQSAQTESAKSEPAPAGGEGKPAAAAGGCGAACACH